MELERGVKWHIIRKDGLSNLTPTVRVEGKTDRGKQQITYLTLADLKLGDIVKRQLLLRVTREGKLWRAMIAQGHT